MRVCSVEGCERQYLASGYCTAHHHRWRRYGEVFPEIPVKERACPPRVNPEIRFWAKVDRDGPTASHMETPCWLWLANTTGRGRHGLFTLLNQQKILAHRFAYELRHGPMPEGQQLDHRCLNKICVNPDHLRPATPKQNNENLSGGHGATGMRGVTFYAGRGYQARVRHHGRLIHVGWFRDLAAAEAAAVAKRNELFTHNELDRAR